MKKEWIIREPDTKIVEELDRHLGIGKVMCQILANRGIETVKEARSFLKSDLGDLRDPYALKDMDKAVARIKKAISKKENILIFSDYDVDGVTSCAILEKELKRLGAHVTHYIPHRVKEGYGLNLNAVKLACKQKVTLLIALDCGIKSFKEVKAFNKHKIDTIIVDHHQPDNGTLPESFAIINPKRHDCSYGFNNFAAVGLVYKLVCALESSNQDRYLDLATLGTIADVMPLVDENRIIVKKGLESINKRSNLGIRALIEASGLEKREINPGRVSFILAPRINASGRVDTAETSLDLLLADSYEEAQEIASHLNTHNRSRQKIQEKVFKEAIDIVERKINFKEHYIIILSREDWHIGVLGIVASKIAEKFSRPAIIISFKDGLGKGSGRSISGFHLFDALLECKGHLKYFGGHSHAVGLTIQKENFESFSEDLNNITRQRLELDQLKQTLEIDAQLPLTLLTQELIKQLKELEPFGMGNSKPVFCSHNLTIKSPAKILSRDTIKFWVSDGECTYEVIGFGLREFASYIVPSKKIDLAYNLSSDSWSDVNSILLEIKDLKLSG